MAETIRRLAPLGHRRRAAPPSARTGGAEVTLEEREFIGKINLRGEPDPPFLGAVNKALGLTPPVEAGAVASGERRAILWTGPNEWLVVTSPGEEAEMAVALRSALEGRHAAVTDVSESLTVITIGGPDARDVLAKGCGLDLHPQHFGSGRCARTGIAGIVVLIHQIDDIPCYDLYVDRSFAEYLWRWFEASASSMFGIPR